MNTPKEKSILVLDDEKSYLDLLADSLSERFVNPIVSFTRPLAALEALPRLDVGLVITDFSMPQLNGLEFIRLARVIKPGVPFMMITGHAVHFTADDFPDIPELKIVVHKPFGGRRLAEEILNVWPAANASELTRHPGRA